VRTKVRLVVEIPPELHEQLEAFASTEERTYTWITTKALESYLCALPDTSGSPSTTEALAAQTASET
jgi:predicted DNA-binding protein